MKKKLLQLIILFAFYSVNAQSEADANPYQKNNEIKFTCSLIRCRGSRL